MITLVGTQSDFLDALNCLLELEYEAIEIYEAAINRIESKNYVTQLKSFKQDHQNHIDKISKYLASKNYDLVKKPGIKQWISIASISFSSIIGDKNVLGSFRSAEEDTNTAYERVNNHSEAAQDFKRELTSFYEDEKRHKKWIEEAIGQH